MKTWKFILAVALAVVAVALMTCIVVAAPASTSSVPANRVFDVTDPILTDTLPTTHPVGIIIAVFFQIPYTQVMDLHNEGFGFGEIARVYLMADVLSGTLTPDEILTMRQDGMGWGQIMKENDFAPGGKGLGSIMRNKPVTSEPGAAIAPKGPKPDNDNNGTNCPGNSCNAPGQQKSPKGKGH